MREQLFWLLDTLQGSVVASHLRELKNVFEKGQENLLEEYQEIRMNRLIKHAKQTTRFYRDFNSFEEFPVINKNIIRQNKENFLSSSFTAKQLTRVTTSGSTGTPFEVFQDTGKRKRQAAENIYFNERCGFRIGDRLYFLRIWNKINRLTYLQKKLKNIVPIEASDLSITNVSSMINLLNADQYKKSLLAYASTYEALVVQLKKMPEVETNVSCCIAMSEALDDQSREVLQKFFGCGVFARYSNSENGFIAHQVPGLDTDYLVNKASFIVEILEMDNDKPVPDGIPGRIVITDLFNFAMPMIRYDTGDVGIAGYKLDEAGKRHRILKKILGRKLDFIRGADDTLISPHVIDYALRRFPGMLQFQIIQETRSDFRLKINLQEGFSIVESDVKNALFTYIDKSANIHIEYVSEIPLLASGKRKIVVSLIDKA